MLHGVLTVVIVLMTKVALLVCVAIVIKILIVQTQESQGVHMEVHAKNAVVIFSVLIINQYVTLTRTHAKLVHKIINARVRSNALLSATMDSVLNVKIRVIHAQLTVLRNIFTKDTVMNGTGKTLYAITIILV